MSLGPSCNTTNENVMMENSESHWRLEHYNNSKYVRLWHQDTDSTTTSDEWKLIQPFSGIDGESNTILFPSRMYGPAQLKQQWD